MFCLQFRFGSTFGRSGPEFMKFDNHYSEAGRADAERLQICEWSLLSNVAVWLNVNSWVFGRWANYIMTLTSPAVAPKFL